MSERVIVLADKTILRIRGISVAGLRPHELEVRLRAVLDTPVRVIGVTGESLDLDVYGMDPDAILRSEEDLITTVSLTDGIAAAEVIQIAAAERAVDVDADAVPESPNGCRAERWRL